MDAQADPSLRWAHTHFVGLVMSWLIYFALTYQLNACFHSKNKMIKKAFEPRHDKTNKVKVSEPSKDSSAQSDQSLRCELNG